jgi:predicted TIM-barrel fold metal-dependent hydrolase
MDRVIVSADSHVMEPVDLWKKGVPEKYREVAPVYPPHKLGEGFQQREGGWDPHARIREMEVDGVSAEVLYPTLMLGQFALADAALQEACFRVYNDWLIDSCSVASNRLIGVAAISVYDIERGVAELERCRRAGLKGALVWQAPHPDLPFHSKHYDRLWAAAQDLDVPVSMHILTGHSYHTKERKGVEHYRGSVNLKLLDVDNALFELIFYGVLDRHPQLRLVTVENEAGWLPFMAQQWDYYYRRFREKNPPPITRDPSQYMREQVFSCLTTRSAAATSSGGTGQPHVVERLSPSELDLAELAEGHPAPSGPLAGGDAGEGARGERLPPLRPRHGEASGRRLEGGAGRGLIGRYFPKYSRTASQATVCRKLAVSRSTPAR